MQRVTISLDEDLAAAFDALGLERGYHSRSEAMRDLVRQAVATRRLSAGDGACVASLSYVVDYRTRQLAQRLTALAHAHHDLIVAVTQVVLDHASSLETMVLRGPANAVGVLADTILAERGVRFGAVNVIAVDPNDTHADAVPGHRHRHGAHASPPRG